MSTTPTREPNFGVIPQTLTSDPTLTAWDHRVFLALDMISPNLVPVQIRARAIAERFGAVTKGRIEMVRRAVRHLEALGHLRVTRQSGVLSTYDLSPAWAGMEYPTEEELDQ